MSIFQHTGISFYRAWAWANGWSELVGLGGAAMLAVLINQAFGNSPSATAAVVSAATLVVAGILFEGALVGYAQGRVLRRALPALSLKRWTLLTATGAGVAWLLGMIPSVIASLQSSTGDDGKPPFEGPMVFVAAAAMGLVLGPFLGVPQYFELRRHVKCAGWWVAANSAAWAVGMSIVFIGATAPSETTPLSIVIPIILATCLAAGLAVGAVHGLFLLRLLEASGDVVKQQRATTA
jgi:hypothetical protein